MGSHYFLRAAAACLSHTAAEADIGGRGTGGVGRMKVCEVDCAAFEVGEVFIVQKTCTVN
jgi:hypothetical protein